MELYTQLKLWQSIEINWKIQGTITGCQNGNSRKQLVVSVTANNRGTKTAQYTTPTKYQTYLS